MSLIVYISSGAVALLVIGAWLLNNALRYADNGYENESGFHIGEPVGVTDLSLSVANATPKSRRARGGSRAPMPIANQAAMAAKPTTARKGRHFKKAGDSNPPIPLGKHSPFPNMFG